MRYQISDLAEFGWSNFFASQLGSEELLNAFAVRVVEVHRSQIRVVGADFDQVIPPFNAIDDDEETFATVGDWLLLDPQTFRSQKLLQRKSLFKRRAPGTARKVQLIAANIDTLFIVSSCNQDFNPARLERYLVLARDAEVTPIVVLTKADLSDTPQDFANTAARLLPGLVVEVVDARAPESIANLAGWCGRGQTIALVGSSGVGKSTLVNTLVGADKIKTQSIRDDDAKGRHTTSARTFHRLPAGGWVLDTPGMRELQMTQMRDGIEEVFADIVALAHTCRFADCQHQTEPGCAVRAAVSSGALDAARLKHWQKLAAEEVFNSESLAERRVRNRSFGKMVKQAVSAKKNRNRS